MRPRWRITPILLSFILSATPALAQSSDADKATARQLGQDGEDALDKKDFKAAEDHFKRADSLYHAPTLALGLARAQAGNGHLVASQETYNRILREGVPPGAPPAFVSALEDAKREINAVVARVAGVTINVTGADNPKVLLDDAPVPLAALGARRPVDPGIHSVKATAEGFVPSESSFKVADGASARVDLKLERDVNAIVRPSPVPSPVTATATTEPAREAAAKTDTPSSASTTRTLGFVALGVGGAGLVVGAVTGVLALSKKSSLSYECPNRECPAAKQSDVDAYHTLGTLSTVGFIAGGVALATGVVLILAAPKSSHPSSLSLSPYVTASSVGAVGEF